RLRSLTPDFSQALIQWAHVTEDTPNDTLHFVFGPETYTIANKVRQVQGRYRDTVSLGGVSVAVSSAVTNKTADIEVLSNAQALERIKSKLKATPMDNTDLVEVSFVANDPKFAQNVVNTAVSVFQKSSADEAQQQSRRRRQFVEEQLRKTDSVLIAAQSELSAFQRKEQVFSSHDQFAAEQAGSMDLRIRRSEMNADRSVYLSLLTNLTNNPKDNMRGIQALMSAPGIAS